MSNRTGIAVGDTVTLSDSNMGTLWRVLDFELRVGGFVFAKITPLGGGMTMRTSADRLALVTRAVAA